ncbi:hypothetical protein AMTRI_Chr07g29980 [Amborella trichopoda]
MELELTVVSAKDLKNVNWRHGDIKPYVVAWVDPDRKFSTGVDEEGDTSPVWNNKLTIPLRDHPEDSTLQIDVVHAGSEEKTKPLIGSATLALREVIEDAGFDHGLSKTLKLKRSSGRPHGKIEVEILIRDRYARKPAAETYDYGRHPAPESYSGYGYGAPPAPSVYAPPTGVGYYGGAAPSGGGHYGNYGEAAPPAAGYYGNYQAAPPPPEKKGSKMGMGTGLAIGAVGGVLGGLALAEGVDYVEDKIADDVTERVEDDLAADEYGDDY